MKCSQTAENILRWSKVPRLVIKAVLCIVSWLVARQGAWKLERAGRQADLQESHLHFLLATANLSQSLSEEDREPWGLADRAVLHTEAPGSLLAEGPFPSTIWEDPPANSNFHA